MPTGIFFFFTGNVLKNCSALFDPFSEDSIVIYTGLTVCVMI